MKSVLFFLWIYLKTTVIYGFETKVNTLTPQGSIIFDGSLPGEGWFYSLNPVRSSSYGLEIVTLPSNGVNGTFMLHSRIKCSKLEQNPSVLVMEARTGDGQRHARFPLHVHVEDCPKTSSKHVNKVTTNSIHPLPLEKISENAVISIQTKSLGTCLESFKSLFSLRTFLPRSIRQNPECISTFNVANDSPSRQFIIQSDSGEVSSANLVCLHKPYVPLKALLTLDCSTSQSIPLELTIHVEIYGKDRPLHVTQLTQPSQVLTTRSSHTLLRKKRQSFMPPKFQNNLYVRNVAEEQSAGVVIDSFVIEDFETRSVTYSLLATRDGRSQDMFAIDPNSGQVTTAERLDRESIPVHYFTIYASDNNNPRISGQAALTIYVDDINDHPPVFESLFYQHDVSESLSLGATVLTVRASDGDTGSNAEIEYSILNPSGPNEVFRIDPYTGSIITRQKLDREEETSYTLQILASDKGPVPDRQTASAIVEITVTDENDNKPQFTKSSYTVDVSEDIDPTGNPVIAEIVASDKDEGANAQIRYSITGGNSYDTFSIDSSTGHLSLSMPLDYEQTESYRLTVRAQDGGSPPKSNSTTVLIRVIDQNDNNPRFLTTLFQEAVLEDVDVGYVVMRVQAYDADAGANSALLYSITEAPANMPLAIDRHTGILSTSRQLDRETNHRFNFKVEAKDQGDVPRTATATIEVITK